MSRAQLGLAHSYSRAKVKFNVNKADNMIIQVRAGLTHEPGAWLSLELNLAGEGRLGARPACGLEGLPAKLAAHRCGVVWCMHPRLPSARIRHPPLPPPATHPPARPQAIALLDTLDKDVNTFVMRVREW